MVGNVGILRDLLTASLAAAPITVNVNSGPWDGFFGNLLQSLVLAGGGIGGIVIYLKRREFQPHVRVGMSARIARVDGQAPRLFIRLHFVNDSGGEARVTARVVLWAVHASSNAYPAFEEKVREWPLDYVYGEVGRNGVMTAETGGLITNYPMEPLECIETEVLFTLDPIPDLMAVRAGIDHRTINRHFWNRPYDPVWEAFAYIDPAVLTGPEYVSLTSHEARE